MTIKKHWKIRKIVWISLIIGIVIDNESIIGVDDAIYWKDAAKKEFHLLSCLFFLLSLFHRFSAEKLPINRPIHWKLKKTIVETIVYYWTLLFFFLNPLFFLIICNDECSCTEWSRIGDWQFQFRRRFVARVFRIRGYA